MRYGSAPDPGINRNILECKGEKFLTCKKQVLVLIETYWNVKEGAAGMLGNQYAY